MSKKTESDIEQLRSVIPIFSIRPPINLFGIFIFEKAAAYFAVPMFFCFFVVVVLYFYQRCSYNGRVCKTSPSNRIRVSQLAPTLLHAGTWILHLGVLRKVTSRFAPRPIRP